MFTRGNKILLETAAARVCLDFGQAFKQDKKYFTTYLRPRGMADYLRLNSDREGTLDHLPSSYPSYALGAMPDLWAWAGAWQALGEARSKTGDTAGAEQAFRRWAELDFEAKLVGESVSSSKKAAKKSGRKKQRVAGDEPKRIHSLGGGGDVSGIREEKSPSGASKILRVIMHGIYRF